MTSIFSQQTKKEADQFPFAVESDSGQIRVTGILDYEVLPVHRLIAIATDNNPSWSAEAMVVVELEDVNDNAPVVVLNSLTAFDTSSVNVRENVNSEQFVGHVTVSDADSGLNGRVECYLSILSGYNAALFTMTPLNHHNTAKNHYVREINERTSKSHYPSNIQINDKSNFEKDKNIKSKNGFYDNFAKSNYIRENNLAYNKYFNNEETIRKDKRNIIQDNYRERKLYGNNFHTENVRENSYFNKGTSNLHKNTLVQNNFNKKSEITDDITSNNDNNKNKNDVVNNKSTDTNVRKNRDNNNNDNREYNIFSDNASFDREFESRLVTFLLIFMHFFIILLFAIDYQTVPNKMII